MAIDAKRRLLEMMKSGKTPLGTMVASIDPAVSTIMGSVGFDFIISDCEHGPMDKVQVLNHVRAAEATGAIPMVRVLENVPAQIQGFLDIGVHGVIVPHVDTAEDARRAASVRKYAPGGRGMCPVCHAARYSLKDWSEHVHHSNENVLIIPLLESRAAVENVAEIIAVDGIDWVLFGPGDLSQDIGLDLVRDQAKMIAQWEKVRDTVHAAGKHVMLPGGFGFEGADAVFQDMDLLMLRLAGEKIVQDHNARQGAKTSVAA